jgi:hypothetical protein
VYLWPCSNICSDAASVAVTSTPIATEAGGGVDER